MPGGAQLPATLPGRLPWEARRPLGAHPKSPHPPQGVPPPPGAENPRGDNAACILRHLPRGPPKCQKRGGITLPCRLFGCCKTPARPELPRLQPSHRLRTWGPTRDPWPQMPSDQSVLSPSGGEEGSNLFWHHPNFALLPPRSPSFRSERRAPGTEPAQPEIGQQAAGRGRRQRDKRRGRRGRIRGVR